MFTIIVSNFWYINKLLHTHLNWILCSLYNLNSFELTLKDNYNAKFYNINNKFFLYKKINFCIYNKNVILVSNKKNNFFFRTFIFTFLEDICTINIKKINIVGYFNNLYFINYNIFDKYKNFSIFKFYAFMYNFLFFKKYCIYYLYFLYKIMYIININYFLLLIINFFFIKKINLNFYF